MIMASPNARTTPRPIVSAAVAAFALASTLASPALAAAKELPQVSAALAYAEDKAASYIEELIDFVSIPSVSTLSEHEADMRAAAAWVKARALKAGLEHAEVMETGAQPLVYADWLHAGPDAPTLLIYAHYDVQPADPFELWTHPPFAPHLDASEGKLYGRGASDDKCGVLMAIHAVESVLATSGGAGLPVNVKLMIDGQEEIGSPQLESFLAKHASSGRFQADFAFSADGGQVSLAVPRVTTSLRGLAALEVHVKTAGIDLHSGMFGGAVPNALHVIADMVAGLHDAEGRVSVPGFYDAVMEMSERERANTEFPTEAFYAKEIGAKGIKEGVGETGFSTFERLTVRPTLEITGMWGGFQGEGVKTVIPAQAHAKIACRLVANQDAAVIQRLVAARLQSLCPSYAECTTSTGHFDLAQPFSVAFDAPSSVAQRSVLEATFPNAEGGVLFTKHGATIPAMHMLQQGLGADTAMMGFSENDNALHAPNEFMRLEAYAKGREAYIRLLFELEGKKGKQSKTEL